jgi:uncharacterized damage-inducible protein DinB
MSTETPPATIGERADLLDALAKSRYFLRFTLRDLTDEQAAKRSTVSELCLGGIIKHVAEVESNWVDFILRGPHARPHASEESNAEWNAEDWLAKFRMLPGETVTGLLEHYQEIAIRTDQVVSSLVDLDDSHPLPEAPWFEKGARWSFRRVILHIIGETTQHAGHADIIRESLDGSKTMS